KNRVRPKGRSGRKRNPHLGRHGIRPLPDIGEREAKQAEAGAEDRVLAPKVFGHAVAMVGAVVLDDQASLRVVEIRPADKPACSVVKVDLDLRPGKAGLDQQPAESRFHRGFRRLSKLVMATETEVEGLIRQDQMLYGLKSPLQVAKSACNCGRWQVTDRDEIKNFAAVHLEARPRA